MAFLKKLFTLTELKFTILRFPAAVLCSLALFCLLVLTTHDFIDSEDFDSFSARLIVLCAYSFFWFVLSRVAAEVRGAPESSNVFEYGLGTAGFAVLAIVVFSEYSFSLAWMLALMLPALLLALSICPYVRHFFQDNDNISFWFYNRQIWFGVVIAIFAGTIWGAGLSAALLSIDYLFEVHIKEEFYADIWSFSLALFAPLYALTWVPRHYHYTEEDCQAPPQLAFVLNWVMAPLVLVYLAILYAYFARIVFAQELPRGQLSYMVTAFASLGIITYLAGWPLREQGGILLRAVHRWFFPALLIPTGVQVLAIYQRIDQYGVTEQRYVIALSAVWFGILAIAYSIRKPPIKLIPALLALLLTIAAIGPVSAPRVAEDSQLNRLEMLLLQNNLIPNGQITSTSQTVSFADRKSISSILGFLKQRGHWSELGTWLSAEQVKTVSTPPELTEIMGFEYVHQYQYQNLEIVSLHSDMSRLLHISGFDVATAVYPFYCPGTGCSGDSFTEQWHGQDLSVALRFQDGLLQVTVKPVGGLAETIGFDVHRYATLEAERQPVTEKRLLFLESTGDAWRIRVVFDYLNLKANTTSIMEEHRPPATTYQIDEGRLRILVGSVSRPDSGKDPAQETQ